MDGSMTDNSSLLMAATDVAQMNMSEQEYHDLLNKQFAQLELRRLSVPHDAASFPQAGSSLAGDDRWTSPFQISHYIRLLISVAADQLHALDNLINGSGTVHPYACSPLIRASIENACMAYWLMDGPTRRARSTRLFRLHWDGVNKRAKFQASAPALAGVADRSARQSRLIEFARAHGIAAREIKERLVITDVVEDVEASIESVFSVSGAWNIFSGITHGQQWAILTLLDREEERDVGGDLVNARLSTGLKQIVWGVGCADAVISSAVDRLLQRGTSQIDIS